MSSVTDKLYIPGGGSSIDHPDSKMICFDNTVRVVPKFHCYEPNPEKFARLLGALWRINAVAAIKLTVFAELSDQGKLPFHFVRGSSVDNCMLWSTTPEGHAYWADVDNQYWNSGGAK